MSKTMWRIVSGVLASAVGLSVILPAFVARGGADEAVLYLENKPKSAWSIMALAAAGKTPSDLSSLTSITGGAIDYAAPIMALAAAGKNPATYPSTDYVAKMRSFWDGIQLGDAGTVNDDIFGALALRAAGVATTDSLLVSLKTYIGERQNADGGFPFSVSGASDTNTTAAAIMALVSLGVSPSDSILVRAIQYLKGAQNDDGGFPYDPVSPWGTDSDASSDAWVMMAITALGQSQSAWSKNDKTPEDHLRSLQDGAAGYVKWQAGSTEDQFTPTTTAYAVIALLHKTFPVAAYVRSTAPHVTYRIAGGLQDVCAGEAYATTPLELIGVVSESCGFEYHLKSFSFGQYVERIGIDTASGNQGWMYQVNAVEPSVGASEYQLQAEDDVVWFFADFGSKITRISLASGSVGTNQSATAFVEYRYGAEWKPLSGASVRTGNTAVSTDETGHATLTLPDGSYALAATATGYVRSAPVALVVGARSDSEIPLSIDLGGGSSSSGGGSSSGSNSISFTVAAADERSSVSFGAITRGETMRQPVVITNRSSAPIHVESIVSGDKVFTTYLTVGGVMWRKFYQNIDGNRTSSVDVGLSVPAEYVGQGVKTGKLIIWASAAR